MFLLCLLALEPDGLRDSSEVSIVGGVKSSICSITLRVDVDVFILSTIVSHVEHSRHPPPAAVARQECLCLHQQAAKTVPLSIYLVVVPSRDRNPRSLARIESSSSRENLA